MARKPIYIDIENITRIQTGDLLAVRQQCYSPIHWISSPPLVNLSARSDVCINSSRGYEAVSARITRLHCYNTTWPSLLHLLFHYIHCGIWPGVCVCVLESVSAYLSGPVWSILMPTFRASDEISITQVQDMMTDQVTCPWLPPELRSSVCKKSALPLSFNLLPSDVGIFLLIAKDYREKKTDLWFEAPIHENAFSWSCSLAAAISIKVCWW